MLYLLHFIIFLARSSRRKYTKRYNDRLSTPKYIYDESDEDSQVEDLYFNENDRSDESRWDGTAYCGGTDSEDNQFD